MQIGETKASASARQTELMALLSSLQDASIGARSSRPASRSRDEFESTRADCESQLAAAIALRDQDVDRKRLSIDEQQTRYSEKIAKYQQFIQMEINLFHKGQSDVEKLSMETRSALANEATVSDISFVSRRHNLETDHAKRTQALADRLRDSRERIGQDRCDFDEEAAVQADSCTNGLSEYEESVSTQLAKATAEAETRCELLDETIENLHSVLEKIRETCEANQNIGRPSDIREIARLQRELLTKQKQLAAETRELSYLKSHASEDESPVPIGYRSMPDLGILVS
jgi:hypothetical protein